jgi:hypothetical protein
MRTKVLNKFLLVSFYCSDRIPEKNTLKGEIHITVLEVSVQDHLAPCFGPEARQNVMVAGACDRGGCSPHSSQEAKKEVLGTSDKLYFSGVHPSDLLPPTKFHIPVRP